MRLPGLPGSLFPALFPADITKEELKLQMSVSPGLQAPVSFRFCLHQKEHPSFECARQEHGNYTRTKLVMT